jgi:hypothetical protein
LTTELRTLCRNPRCRSKLPAPVENPRSAFCARGCHRQFYRSRCLVCERPMERKTERKQLCGRPRCKSEFRALQQREMLGSYLRSTSAPNAAGNPIKQGVSAPLNPAARYRIVAGPVLSDRQLALATVGAAAVLAQNRRVNVRFWDEAALIKRDTAPVNLIGGYRFPGAPQIRLSVIPLESELVAVAPSAVPIAPADAQADPLKIPAFLRREPTT